MIEYQEEELDEYNDNPIDAGPHLIWRWSSEQISQHGNVIVEMWDHKDNFKAKRLWQSEFTEPERKKIGELYRKCYAWYLRTGYPPAIQMSLKTYDLLVRAANYFASIN